MNIKKALLVNSLKKLHKSHLVSVIKINSSYGYPRRQNSYEFSLSKSC